MKKIAILGHQEVTKILAESLSKQDISLTIISLSPSKASNIQEYVNLEDYCKKIALISIR